MSRGFRIVLYFLIAILLLALFCLKDFTFLPFLFEIVCIIIIEINLFKKNKATANNGTKLCKYCRVEIDSKAVVCPNCKRGLNFNTNTSVLIILLFMIGLIFWGIFSNDAPLVVRETVCGLGIRDDFPYCYDIKIK